MPVYLRMLLYTPLSFNSNTNASAEKIAKGQKKGQNWFWPSGSPATRTTSTTANDSITIKASTIIAAPRRNAGGDPWKARCSRSTAPKTRSPIPRINHIALYSNS